MFHKILVFYVRCSPSVSVSFDFLILPQGAPFGSLFCFPTRKSFVCHLFTVRPFIGGFKLSGRVGAVE